MANAKTLKLSVIIPVYNEERHIEACLEGVVAQIEAPYEVIVVDNNCTDNTISLARKYKFVRVVKERKQGLIAARNRGFNAAKGDILCRIDADAVLVPDWTRRVRSAFASDKGLSGATGLALTRVIPRVPYFRTRLYAWGYFWAVCGFYRTQVLWGANMAVRRSAWQKVRAEVCLDDRAVHEDQDVALHILAAGGKIQLVHRMDIRTEGQVYHYFPKLKEYILRTVNTRRLHRQFGLWPVPPQAQISRPAAVWRLATSAPPWFLFCLASFLYWPIDGYMLTRRGRKDWLGL